MVGTSFSLDNKCSDVCVANSGRKTAVLAATIFNPFYILRPPPTLLLTSFVVVKVTLIFGLHNKLMPLECSVRPPFLRFVGLLPNKTCTKHQF